MKYFIFLIITICVSSACKDELELLPGHREDLPLPNTQLTVEDVLDRIKSNLTCEWTGGPIDTIKTGALTHPVTGIATTFMATMEVIEKAQAEGLNMIITHEPTFYNHFDNMSPLKGDPVQEAKLKFIIDSGITIFRFHDFWHRTRPDGINQGLIEALEWEDYGNPDAMLFEIPETSVLELSNYIAGIFSTSTVRVVGNPEMKLNKVGIVPGAWGSNKQIEVLNQPGVDAVIVGESREWETIEYVRDMNTLGMPKALIVMGHADSEDPGMKYCATWLSEFISEVPIQFIRAGNPMWTPE